MVKTEMLFPKATSNLKARGTRPFKVLRHHGTHVYELDLSMEHGVNPTFNVVDQVSYKGPAVDPSELLEPIPTLESDPTTVSPPLAWRARHEHIDEIMDE